MNNADRIFLNGNVITVDDNKTIAEAIAISNNKILGVGTNYEIKKYRNSSTEVIDLKGNTLMPGIIDSHVHLTISGINLLDLNCQAENISSLDALIDMIEKETLKTAPGHWIRVWAFNEYEMDEQRFPTLEELDKVSPSHPLVIVRVCNHTSMTNTRGLMVAGINGNSKNPDGGIIERDSKGYLTGVFLENAHMQLSTVFSHDEEELISALALASKYFLTYGITSVHDAGGYGNGNVILNAMKKSIETKDIQVRIYAMIGSLTNSESFIKSIIESDGKTGDGDEWFKIGPAKLFTDGSSTGPTIGTREGYTSDQTNNGILYYQQNELNVCLGKAHELGFQITAHAQGDRAVEMVLDCIEDALIKHPRLDHRHRIEHAGIAPEDLQLRMKELNVIPVPNPSFIYMNGESYVKNYGERVNEMYPVRDYIDKGIIAPIASDAPVVEVNPFLGIHAAVNRSSKEGNEIGENQSISLMEGIEAYTKHSAYASFDEDIKGSLVPGLLADLIVLDRNLLNTPIEEIKNVQVELTMIDGEIVFER